MVNRTSVDRTQVMVVFERTAQPLSEVDIRRVERRLGVHLPHDLKEHYLVHNGGRPRPRFLVKDGEPYGVHQFLAMNTGGMTSSFEHAYVMLVDQTPEFPRGYIPFGYDESGDYFLYSVKPDSFGKIMFNVSEYLGDDDRFVVFLAASLREFVNSLSESDALSTGVRASNRRRSTRQQSVVKMRLTGSRTADVNLANELGGFTQTPDGYIWHDVDDLNPQDGTCSLELVREDPHRATYPHTGSVAQYEKHHGVRYKR
jgi:cell wall assembly regulator SMI1